MEKTVAKRQKVRMLIFGREPISRQELIRQSALSERCVIRYAAELCEQNLAFMEIRKNGRGRPGVYYHSNSDRIFLLGVAICYDWLILGAIDINGCPLLIRRVALDARRSHSDLLKLIFSEIDQLRAQLPDYTLFSVGASCDLRQQIDSAALVAGFEIAVRRRYQVPAEIHGMDELILRRFAEMNLFNGAVGGIFVCEEYDAVVIRNQQLSPDGERARQRIRHYVVEENSPDRCFCGKYGCAGVAMNYSGIIRRYRRIASDAEEIAGDISHYNMIHLRAEQSESAALQIIRENGLIHGRIAARFRREFKLDQVVLMHTNPLTFQVAEAEFRRLLGSSVPPLLACNSVFCESCFLAAGLMRKNLLDFKTLQEKE